MHLLAPPTPEVPVSGPAVLPFSRLSFQDQKADPCAYTRTWPPAALPTAQASSGPSGIRCTSSVQSIPIVLFLVSDLPCC